jgi:hypothetical protein
MTQPTIVPVTITPDPPTSPTSPKVWAATIGSLLASMALGLVVAIQASPEVLGGLPPVLVFAIVAVLPGLATFLGGYAKRDRTREIGQQALNALGTNPNEETDHAI